MPKQGDKKLNVLGLYSYYCIYCGDDGRWCVKGRYISCNRRYAKLAEEDNNDETE